MVYTFSNGTHGYDFGDADTEVMECDLIDAHGTMVSGVLAAEMNNDLGIAGTAQITILPVKVVPDSNPFSWLAVAAGIRYAADLGVDVISMSLGEYYCDQAMAASWAQVNQSIEYAWSRGCLLVAASGNDETAPLAFPARHPLVIAVGVTDQQGIVVGGVRIAEKVWELSSYLQNVSGEVCCVAPGDLVISTYRNATQTDLYEDAYSGTSLAAPHVAGCLGLMYSYRPSMTNQEAWRVLNATCDDLLDPDEDDAPTYSDDPGFDEFSGWGIINVSNAVSYANLQRDQWSHHTLVTNNSVSFNFSTSTPAHRQAVAVDSQGFTHVAWIDKRLGTDSVFYSSVEPSGRKWTNDTSIETGQSCLRTASSYVDIFVDNLDYVHLTWLDDGDIHYTRLTTQGVINMPAGNPSIIQVTNSASNAKEYLNIVTDDTIQPSIYIYYCIQNTSQGADWDVAWSTIQFVAGRYRVMSSDALLINTASNLRRVYADIGLLNFLQERVFLTYQDDAQNNWDVHWRQYDLNGILEAQSQLTSDEVKDYDPHIDVSYRHGISAVVWCREGETEDYIFCRIMEPGATDHTYGGVSRIIGYPYQPTIYGTKEYPRVAIGVIQNLLSYPYTPANMEIHVVWRQLNLPASAYQIYHTHCSADGRSFQAPDENVMADEGYGYPLVTTVDEGSVSIPHYIKDGHFRATWFQRESATGNHAIAYRTTNAMWKGIRNITDTNEVEKDSDLVIDANGDYHLAWTEEDGSGHREICYANWIDSNPYSAPTTSANITHNASNDDSYRPKIVTFEESGVMKVTMIWIDTDIRQNGDIWITTFEAEDPSQVDLQPTNISCSPEDNNLEYDHRIAYDEQNQWIAITWCEDYNGDRALWVGVVDYANTLITQEHKIAYGVAYDCYDPSICIEEQTCSVNIAYVRVYASGHNVHYTQINVGAGEYSKYFDVNITDGSNYRYPEIAIDHETRRFENNTYAIRSDFNNRDRFVHIIYSDLVNVTTNPYRYALLYQKLCLNGTNVIDEKMILPDDFWLVPTFRSRCHIRSVIRLDEDNRLEVIHLSKVFRGNIWPVPSAKVSVFYTKIDNNGEILCAEMFINDNETYNCQDLTTAPDSSGQLHVVWTENSNLRYCSNGTHIG